MVQTAADAGLSRADRWEDEEDLDVPLWHRRTAFMIRLLKEVLGRRGELRRPIRMLELGCGAMAAEQILASHGLEQIEYIPSDVVPRDHRTLVIDLEHPRFAERVPSVDVCFLGGVLEHLSDPEAVLRGLAGRCRWLLFSYCPRTPGQEGSARRGWKNHLTAAEMKALASSLGGCLIVDDGFDRGVPDPVRTYFVELPVGVDGAPSGGPERALHRGR